MGTLVPLPALWHFNGAGIGFPQRSCKAEVRCCQLRFYAQGNSGSRVRTTWCDSNPPEDQEDAVERVEVA